MREIIVALNNEEKFKKIEKIRRDTYKRDILYKEGILEILEKKKNISLIILNSLLPGNISIENLIKKIRKFNKNIQIIIWLPKCNSNQNNDFKKDENMLFFYNMKQIYQYLEKTKQKVAYQYKKENRAKVNNLPLKNNQNNSKYEDKNRKINNKKSRKLNKEIIIVIKELNKCDEIKKLKNKWKKNKKISLKNFNQINKRREKNRSYFIFSEIKIENIKEKENQIKSIIKKEKIEEKSIILILIKNKNIEKEIIKKIITLKIKVIEIEKINFIIYYLLLKNQFKKIEEKIKEIVNGIGNRKK